MEYIKFCIDEHVQSNVYCMYKEIKDGVKGQTIQRSFPIEKIAEHEPKILEMIVGEIIGVYYENKGSIEVSEIKYLDRDDPIPQEEIEWIKEFVKKVCLELAYDDLLKPPSIDEQVEDFIKEFFNDEDSEPIQQDDFLSKFFEEVDEAGGDLAPSKDVVAEHFASVEEQPLQEKDFLSEFFAELEADQPTK